ncbi:hypothetical protein ACL9RL_07055 [Plantibacter sp. Mn2098]|uniref:hypothetical protein n=1 Tax=Plantibacter sp. Mn2098 TaxID=3395266 RepID=UPI003BE101FE
MSEDSYLPKIVVHLQRLVSAEAANHLDGLTEFVESRLAPEKIGRPHMRFFQSDSNDDSSTVDVTDAELANSYIYGYAVKEDEAHRELIRLLGANSLPTRLAILSQVSYLMQTVFVVRKQVEMMADSAGVAVTVEH